MKTPRRSPAIRSRGRGALLMLAAIALAGVVSAQTPASVPAAPGYVPVSRAECFPLEQLAPDDRALAAEWLEAALDREALYTIAGGLKPISSAGRSLSYKTDDPDLSEVDRARRIAGALRCGEGLTAHVHLYAATFKGERSAQIIFVNRPALDELLARRREFFAPIGLSPGTPPVQVLATVEHLPRESRFRGLGYLFGYPDYAVDFFVEATVEGAEIGPGKDREFYSVPVHHAEKGYFIWAVPLGHKERAEDRAIADRAAPILESYRLRRERFIGEGKPGVAELLRDWLCDESGTCGVDRGLRRSTAARGIRPSR